MAFSFSAINQPTKKLQEEQGKVCDEFELVALRSEKAEELDNEAMNMESCRCNSLKMCFI
jgi:hypothetical protein